MLQTFCTALTLQFCMKIEICPDSWWRDRRPGARSAPPRTPPASRPPPASASPASTLSGSWSSSCWCWSSSPPSSPVSSRLCHCGKCLDHWRLWCCSDDDESLQRLDSTAEDCWRSWWWSDIALSDDNARLNLTSSLLNSLDTTEEKLPRCWQLLTAVDQAVVTVQHNHWILLWSFNSDIY